MINPYQILEIVFASNKGWNAPRDTPHYSKDRYYPKIYIYEGFELSHDQDYGGLPDTTVGAYRLEPNNSTHNIYSASPAIYVHEASLQDPVKKARIENDIREALWNLSRGQISTYNSHVEIHGNASECYTLQVY